MTEPTKEGAPASGRKSFSVVARMVLALKRFESAINPTYAPGKRHTADEPGHMAPGVAAAQAAGGGGGAPTASGRRTVSNRTVSGRDIGPPGAQHGHKGHILLRPLPEPEDTAAAN